jgi:hypothetical protein
MRNYFVLMILGACALASIVACSGGETSGQSEDIGATSEALHVNTKCPPSAVPGASCPHANMTCLAGPGSICAPFAGPYVTCERTAKGTLTWSNEFCTNH